jgi:hypothetical protein
VSGGQEEFGGSDVMVVDGGGASTGGIFAPAPTSKPMKTLVTEKPTSSLNLIGQLETWRVQPATPVRNITVTINEATGAQIDALLKKLPDGMVFGLKIEVEEQ